MNYAKQWDVKELAEALTRPTGDVTTPRAPNPGD
jgi:hypothetical protein